jgi:hypothetical protein
MMKTMAAEPPPDAAVAPTKSKLDELSHPAPPIPASPVAPGDLPTFGATPSEPSVSAARPDAAASGGGRTLVVIIVLVVLAAIVAGIVLATR